MSSKRRGRPGKTPDNPVGEVKFRKQLLLRAKTLGCDIELQQIFDKFDRILKNCTNESELKHIQAVGAAEVHKLFGCRGGLVVDGKVVIPAEVGYENVEGGGKIVKI